MIKQDIYIRKYGWKIIVFYIINDIDIKAILKELINIDCDIESFINIYYRINYFNYNEGITYTNQDTKDTIVIIFPSTSPEELSDTINHEKGHCLAHISETLNINPFGEEIQYINGYISKKVFKESRKLLYGCEKLNQDLFSIRQ